ncbi:hypothetical protein [Azospirillum soli]|uniref:hypothetical protein n=1 Tax=Azospirillum soli TaxID=1304799 RepID=UPI001AE4579F|nr:hypothetical protein [Azospirillum soli]MBP2315772.1 hypothetical protein [Azospirillum soli]
MQALILALVLSLAAAPATADGPLRAERTDPDHLRPLDRTVTPQEFIPPRIQYQRSQVVYNLPDGLKNVATFDRTLSRLCQRGAFIQQSDGFYAARTKDKRYGVAFSGGANLDDPQNQRKPGKVYFFDGQDSRCSVYVGDQAKLMPHYVGPRR